MAIKPNDLLLMDSTEVLDETIRRDTKEVAGATNLKPVTIRKWKEPVPTDDEPDNSGSKDPLLRVDEIITTIKKIDKGRSMLPIWWLNIKHGLLPPMQLPDVEATDKNILKAILEWHKEVGETCEKLNKALEDGRITGGEYNEAFKELFEDLSKGMSILFLMKERVR